MGTDDGTSATRPDPETGAEGDTDQLTQEDMLVQRGVDALLDEGWSPPDRPTDHRFGLTEREEIEGETLDRRLARELPDVWEAAYRPDADTRDPLRAGRLTADGPDLAGESTESLVADDVGIAGGAATAEEAAMHLMDDDEHTLDDDERVPDDEE